MRPFSQPPCASPLAAIEQKNRNASSSSMISLKTVRADSIPEPPFPSCTAPAPAAAARTWLPTSFYASFTRGA